MWTFLLRLFRGRAARPPAPRAAVPGRAPGAEKPAFATAPPAPPGCAPELLARAAEQVLERFRASKPGPESFPGQASRIIEELNKREPDFNRLVRIFSQDAAIAARLLQIANSPLYADGVEVNSVRAAATRLGLREVSEIALGLAGRSLFEIEVRAHYQVFQDRWDALFHSAMTAAFATGALSLRTRSGQPDCAFLAGMLHDVGKPVALRALTSLHIEDMLVPGVIPHGIDDVVERVHVEIGAAIAAAWGLPEYLRAAAGHHHDADVAGDAPHLHLVRIVDGLAAARAGTLCDDQHARLLGSAAALHLSAAELRVAAAEYGEHAARVAQMFGVPDPVATNDAAAAAEDRHPRCNTPGSLAS